MTTEFDEPRPNGNTAGDMKAMPVMWPILIGSISGLVFYLLFAFLILHKLIGSLFENEPFACRVMSDPINLFTIMAFTTAMALLFARGRVIRREEKAFDVDILPADDQTLILPDDGLEYRKRLRQLEEGQRELVLFRLLSSGLQRARANWSSEDAGAAVTTQAELIQSDVDSQYSLVKYLAWAIPSIGFIGTVLGIGQAMGSLKTTAVEGEETASPLDLAAAHLNTAFDTTFVALILSLILMFFVHRIQAREDSLVARATNWCMQRFVFRMHITPETANVGDRS